MPILLKKVHHSSSHSSGRPAEYWPAFIEQIPYTRARDVTPKWPEISVGYQTALQNALTLKQTPEEAVKEGQKIIDEALAK